MNVMFYIKIETSITISECSFKIPVMLQNTNTKLMLALIKQL